MKTRLILLSIAVSLLLTSSFVTENYGYVAECSASDIDDKVLTDVDCWMPGQIQKRCLPQTNKCCNAAQATSCL
jgi:hypothetical protein